jgi:hypothetical protein
MEGDWSKFTAFGGSLTAEILQINPQGSAADFKKVTYSYGFPRQFWDRRVDGLLN